jgi:hypothetical protein
LGGIVYWQGDYAAMVQPFDEAVTIAQEVGDRRVLSRALYDSSFVPFIVGPGEEQERLLRRALEEAEDDDLPLKADVLMSLAYIPWFHRGDWRAAAGLMEQAFAMCREAGEIMRLGEVLAGLAAIRLLAGDMAESTRILRDAIEIQLGSRSPAVLGTAMGMLAILEVRTGDHVVAARLLGAWERLRDDGAGSPPPFARSLFSDPEEQISSAIGERAFQRARADGYAMTFEQARNYTRELIEQVPA